MLVDGIVIDSDALKKARALACDSQPNGSWLIDAPTGGPAIGIPTAIQRHVAIGQCRKVAKVGCVVEAVTCTRQCAMTSMRPVWYERAAASRYNAASPDKAAP